MLRLLSLLLLGSFLQISCVKDIVTDTQIKYVKYSDQEYAELTSVLDLPRNFHNYSNDTRAFNSVTRATLGRVLFYDKNLSEDRSVSCASCHKQEKAFADDAAFSKGIFGRNTDRNSLALGVFESFSDEYGGNGSGGLGAFGNGSGGLSSLFWDLRVTDVHSQIVETMANEKEMGMTTAEALDRIKGQRHYEILFEKAFQTTKMDGGKMLVALESFMMSMTAADSKFDKVHRGFDETEPQEKFTAAEARGEHLFDAHCASCHGRTVGKSAIGGQFANNGLDKVSADRGFGAIVQNENFDGVFKIPSLRNVALTGPYMHDGRFETLEEVIDFYSKDIQDHQNLHPMLRDELGHPLKLNLSEDDKDALLAFLNTLTDMSELGHEKFSDPWL